MTQANKKILIVEDELSLRNALRDKLSREDFAVLEARNGEEGLAVALREHPDLILLDIIMPVMDGMTMMKKLRQEKEWGKNVPIILLTNLGSDDKTLKDVTEDKPSYYLVKSNWTLRDVVEKIKELLRESDSRDISLGI